MDRDIVNALHALYRNGEMEVADLGGKLWCGPDSMPSVKTFTELDGTRVRIGDVLMGFLKSVEDQLANLPKPDYVFSFPLSGAIRRPGEQRPCFVAMPYGMASFDAIRAAIVQAAAASKFEPEISLDVARPGVITDQIWQGIRASDVVVADLTGSNPNVFYELGLAHALGKEVILVSQDRGAPFDIRTSRQISYRADDLPRLRADLEAAFAAVTARYPHEGSEPRF